MSPDVAEVSRVSPVSPSAMGAGWSHSSVRAGLIPGVHRYCDEWCDYCPMTARCLAHYDALERGAWRGHRSSASPIMDQVDRTRLTGRAGASSVEDPATTASGEAAYAPAVSDADRDIQLRAERCAVEANRFLRMVGWTGPAPHGLRSHPPPLDVVAWYYLFLVTKTCRALMAIARADGGCAEAFSEARGMAKVILIGIDRSRAALGQLARESNRSDVQRLVQTLDELASMVEARIPGARTFLRPGFDTRAE